MKMRQSKLLIHVAAALGLATGSSAALAYDVWLSAESFTKAMPDATNVTMWGYSACGTGFSGCTAATSPGPQITVPAGESSLTIHLRNNLSVPTSIVIPGQPAPLVPVKVSGRVEAFTSQVAAGGGVGTYTWNGLSSTGLRPGTFLYQSGSHVQLQVQMGLYGALVHDVSCAPLSCAYAGVPYENQQVLVFSEIDPALHNPTPKPVNATVGGYAPRYFLINGEAAPPAGAPVAPGGWVLLRMVNAGLENHAPELLDGYFDVVAEDGNPISPILRRQQYNALLPAAKSLDVIFTPGGEPSYPLFDRRLRLVNGDETGGGMRTSIATAGDAVSRPAVANDSYTTLEDTPLPVAAPGLLLNDASGLSVAFHSDPAKGVLAPFGTDGSFTYTPKPNLNGTDLFTYRGVAGTTATNAAVVTVNVTPVNDAPVAGDDLFLVDRNVLATGNGNNPTGTFTFQVPAPGVLGNDSDVDVNTTLSALNRSAVTLTPAQAGIVPSVLATNGSFSVAFNPSSPNTNGVRRWVGYATFTYDACDVSGATCPAPVLPDAAHADQGTAVVVKDARVRSQQAADSFTEGGGTNTAQRNDIASSTSSSRYIQNESAVTGFPQQLRVWDLKTELRPLTGLSAATPLILSYYFGSSAASPLIGTCTWTGAGAPTCTPGTGASLAANGSGTFAAMQNATCSQASTVACRMRIALPNGSTLIPSGNGTASITLVATVPATGTTIPAHSVTMPGVAVPIHN